MQASWFWHRTHRLKILPKPQIESYTKGHSKIDSKKKTTRSGRIRHYWKALRNKPQKLYSSVSRTMCWSFSAQHWISKYKNILVIGILHAGKLHEFGVWIKRPQRKKILCMHTACYPVHPLHEKFCYQNNMSFCLHLTLLSCRIGAFILQAQVFRYLGFLLLRHKFISLFMIFGVQIQTTNYQPGYFVLFFFLCYMVQWYHIE